MNSTRKNFQRLEITSATTIKFNLINQMKSNIIYFSYPLKSNELFNNPNSYPDLKIKIIVNKLITNIKEIHAHRCIIASASGNLSSLFETQDNQHFLTLTCSTDFEAMHCEKAIKSIYTTITLEFDEFPTMYEMYKKLGMISHLEYLKQLWIIQCQQYSPTTTTFTLTTFGRENPYNLDNFTVQLVLLCIYNICNGSENTLVLPVHYLWLSKFIESQHIILHPENVLSLIDASLGEKLANKEQVESLIRMLFCKLDSKMTQELFFNIVSQLSCQNSVYYCFNILSQTFKLEMISLLLKIIKFTPLYNISNVNVNPLGKDEEKVRQIISAKRK